MLAFHGRERGQPLPTTFPTPVPDSDGFAGRGWVGTWNRKVKRGRGFLAGFPGNVGLRGKSQGP